MKQKYDTELKQTAITRVLIGEKVQEVSSSLSIPSSNIYAWVGKKKGLTGVKTNANHKRTEGLSAASLGIAALAGDAIGLQSEVKRLKAALKRAEEERNILKKATAYFSALTQ